MIGVSDLFDFFLNRCPSCGLAATTICARCWYVLNEVGVDSENRRGLFVGSVDPFTQRGLYRWDESSDHASTILRDVILSSKGTPSVAMTNLWAHEFHRRGTIDGLFSGRRDWIVVTPPGRAGSGTEDHAGALAKALVDRSCGQLILRPALFERRKPSIFDKSSIPKAETSQKIKSRRERSNIEFRMKDSDSQRLGRVPGFLFVDDVIVTGATARAAWIALGRPRAFEAWAIALRSRNDGGGLDADRIDLRAESLADTGEGRRFLGLSRSRGAW